MMVKRLKLVILVIGLVNVVMTLGSLLKDLYWAFDVMTHFNVQYVIGLTLALIVGLVVRLNWRWLALFVVALIPNIFILWPYFTPQPVHAAPEREPLTLVAINVSTRSDHYDQVTDYIREVDADITVLLEVRQDLLDHIDEALTDTHPHVYGVPSRFTLGSAFVSKHPFTIADTVQLDSDWRRFLKVAIEWEGRPVTFFSVHPFPPTAPRMAQSRNDEYRLFEVAVAAVDTPLVMMGDFNAAPWSSPIDRLTQVTGLRPAMLGFGAWPTWAWLGVIQAPLDYMLVSPQWEVVDYEIGRSVGSDHRPVLAEVQLR
jgi:endonuclease/exonuclease/phosphatase (EEP) superfamily protein YafD